MEATWLKIDLEKHTPSMIVKDPRVNAINAKDKLISPFIPNEAAAKIKAKMNQKGSILSLHIKELQEN